MWDYCGMARNAAGLQKALELIPELRDEFWRNVNVPGSDAELNQALEKAGRVADFLELGELMCRTRSTGRNRAAATSGRSIRPRTARPCGTTSTLPTSRPGNTRARTRRRSCTKEPLEFEYVHLAQRSYK